MNGDFKGEINDIMSRNKVSVLRDDGDRGSGKDGGYTTNLDNLSLICKTNKPTTKEETTMNMNIVSAFPKTEDSVLVEAQLGNQIDDKFITGLVLKNYSKEVLAEAVKLKKAAEK